MEVERVIVIDKTDGSVLTLNDDVLPNIGKREKPVRASVVEPGLVEGSEGWDVVLTDCVQNGKWAGHVVATNIPLDQRQLALKMERDFINTHILGSLEEGE